MLNACSISKLDTIHTDSGSAVIIVPCSQALQGQVGSSLMLLIVFWYHYLFIYPISVQEQSLILALFFIRKNKRYYYYM